MKKLYSWLRKHKYLIFLLLTSLFVHNTWLTFGIQSYGDTFYEFPQTIEAYISTSERSSWNSLRDLGGPNIEPYFYIFYAIRGLFSVLHLYYTVSSFFVFYIPIIIAAPLGMYWLARRIKLSKLLSAVAGAIYSFNTYFFVIQTQHLPISVAYAIAPLTMSMFIGCLKKINDTKNSRQNFLWHIAASLVVSIQIISEPRIFLILLPAYIYIFAKCLPTVTKKIKSLSILSVLILLMNIYWVPTFLLGSGGQVASTVDRSLFGSQYKSLESALTLMHPSWTGAEPIAFTLQPTPLYMWIIPAVIVLGLMYVGNARKRLYIGLLMMALVGIFLVKQSHEPISLAYQWLYNTVPGFNLFRESSKFYIITALAYSLLGALSLESLKAYYTKTNVKARWGRYIPICTLGAVVGVCLINALPLINHSIGALFINRHVPADYVQLNSLLARDQEFYRTAWLPTTSRWAYSSVNHPTLNLDNVANGKWRTQLGFDNDNLNTSTYRKILRTLPTAPVAQELFNSSSVKYLVIPTRDAANDDDFFKYYGNDRRAYLDAIDKVSWLKRVDIGTKQLAIYLNTGYKPYFTASDTLTKYDSLQNANAYQNFAVQVKSDSGLNFADKLTKSTIPVSAISNPFDGLTNNQNDNGKLSVDLPSVNSNKTEIYEEKATPSYNYRIKNSSVLFNKSTENLVTVGGNGNNNITDQPIGSYPLNPGLKYSFAVGEKLYGLDMRNNTNRNIGNTKDTIKLYSSNATNIVKDGSFETDALPPKLKDCNRYDDQGYVGAQIDDKESKTGHKSVVLGAELHTACIDVKQLPVLAGDTYALSFDYKVKFSQRSGFEVTFNDSENTVTKADQYDANGSWRNSKTVFIVPKGATTATIRLKGYPDDNNGARALTYYDDIVIEKLKLVVEVASSFRSEYSKVTVPARAKTTLSVKSAVYPLINIVPNSSLESGLWREKVGDCNDYDDNPQIKMSQSTVSSKGNFSLELIARRHVACTGPQTITVKEGKKYLFSFDHESPSSSNAGYYISFNDANKSNLGGQVPIKKSEGWRSFSRVITIPYGVSKFDLTLYSYAGDLLSATSVNRYDNVSFVEIPDISTRYYVTSKPLNKLVQPKVTFGSIKKPSKKEVVIKDVVTPFYLTMSESYDPNWRLLLADAAGKSSLPIRNPTSIDSNDHFSANGFMNGWYVDPIKVCQVHNQSCVRGSNGSYTLKLVAEFTPQRWFNFGLLVSGASLMLCLAYFTYCVAQRKTGNYKNVVWRIRR